MPSKQRSHSLLSEYPLVAAEFDSGRAGVGPSEVAPRSSRKFPWICAVEHRWEAPVQGRTTLGQGCPFCAGRRAIPGETSLAAIRPDLLEQWDWERNRDDPDSVLPGATTKFYWICPAGPDHQWAASGKNRHRKGTGCPACSGNQVWRCPAGNLHRLDGPALHYPNGAAVVDRRPSPPGRRAR
ncbi:zinc-ribbon domain-containing protein [Nocardioides sambongensis]|uniref:zinc-ribbon domain-containing protein n=1 Tax=Nocardioides sambongensis TaxID=2589074 RepID=UPI0011287957